MDFLKEKTMSDEMADRLLGAKGCRVFKARIVVGDCTSEAIKAAGIRKTTIGGVLLSPRTFGSDDWESMDCEVIIIPKSGRRDPRIQGHTIDQAIMSLNDDSEWKHKE